MDELQKRIDDFMTAHEERLEQVLLSLLHFEAFMSICLVVNSVCLLSQERHNREAKAAEGGWTVVVHHKGRKKTTDSESGIAVGSVSQAALEDKVAKKKQSEPVAHGFYRFQRREAQRNGKSWLFYIQIFLYPGFWFGFFRVLGNGSKAKSIFISVLLNEIIRSVVGPDSWCVFSCFVDRNLGASE